MNRKELEQIEAEERLWNILDIVGNITLAILWVIGVILVVSGIRSWITQHNLFDAVVRVVLGGAGVAVLSNYFRNEWRRWQWRWRKF